FLHHSHPHSFTTRRSSDLFQESFYTPADIEGLTLEAACFTRKGEFEELWLRDVPPRVFSEAMRDLDLVVSVAHQGGVDPEATASDRKSTRLNSSHVKISYA